jgi:hypothetical protein
MIPSSIRRKPRSLQENTYSRVVVDPGAIDLGRSGLGNKATVLCDITCILELDHQLIGQKLDQPIVDGRIETSRFFCFKSTEDALALLMSEWPGLNQHPVPSRGSERLVLLP